MVDFEAEKRFDEIVKMVEKGEKLPSTASPEDEFAYQELKFAATREKEKVIAKNVARGMRTRARRWFFKMRELRLRYMETVKAWQDSLVKTSWLTGDLMKSITPGADPWELLRQALVIIARYEGHKDNFYTLQADEKFCPLPPDKIIRTPVGLMPAAIMEKHNVHREKDTA